MLAQIDAGLRGRFSYPGAPSERRTAVPFDAVRDLYETWFAASPDHLLDLGIAAETDEDVADCGAASPARGDWP